MQRVPTTVSLLCATPGLETGHLSWVPGTSAGFSPFRLWLCLLLHLFLVHPGRGMNAWEKLLTD